MRLHLKQIAILLTTSLVGGLSLGGACNENTIDGDGSTHPRLEGDSTANGSDKEAKVAYTPNAELAPGTLDFTLRPGTPDLGKGDERPPAKADKLSDGETQQVLSRLPAISSEEGDVVEFALREGSKPPPLTGETVLASFPPPVAPDVPVPEVEGVTPSVLRYQPEGDVPLAPRISITFSTPMVAITSHDTLALEQVPAKLSPTIEGNWRWVGTKTLFFDPVGRAPMATDFKVEVPAGVKDALGRPLAEGKSFTFKTPPPSIVSSSPGGDSVALDPAITVLFDQRIDAKVALQAVKVTLGTKTVKARALTEDEAKKDLVGWKDNKDIEGRWLVFRLEEKLPKDSYVSVTFPKGFPSAEGPRKTEKELSFSFKTYGPLKVVEARCGWRDECYPGMAFQIQFSNPLDEESLDPKQVSVSPAIKGFRADASWHNLTLGGLTKGKTSYEVVLDKSIKDIYGQTLDSEETFKWRVGPSRSILSSQLKGMTVLDPVAKKRRLPVYVMNMEKVEVELYKVAPSDYSAYLEYLSERWNQDEPPKPPGTRVFSQTVKTEAPAEELFEFGVDLGPALSGEFGQVIAIIRPTGIENSWERDSMTAVTWVQATQIGLDAFYDGEDLIAWTTALGNGEPLADIDVTLVPQDDKKKTNGSGLASFGLPSTSGRQMLVAKRGEDIAFLPDDENSWNESGNWVEYARPTNTRWLTFDDRHLYRPDETVSVKGVVRDIEGGRKGDVAMAGSITAVRWTAFDSTNNKLGEGESLVSTLGTFHLQLKLPKTPNLGGARIELRGGSSNTSHYFEIQEFRRPEFEVGSTVSDGPHMIGKTATVSITASYFAGGPLPNAAVTWNVSSSPSGYAPPNNDEFVFGQWTPWWDWNGRDGGWQTAQQSLSGMTDASGTHTVALDFKGVNPPRPVSVMAEATVEDVNRQTWSTSSSILVHPSSVYVGLKVERYFVEQGRPIELDVIAVNIDGNRQADIPVEVEIVRLDWRKVKKEWIEVEEDRETCKVVSAKDAVRCKFTPKEGGRHRITARIEDKDKRPNTTSLSVWVPGGKVPANRDLERESLTLIPSKQKYEPGETAEVLVQAPFSKGSGVYLTVRDGVAVETPFVLKEGSAKISIPIEEWMIPNLGLSVYLNGEADRVGDDGKPNPNLPKRPAYAMGSLSLSVPPTLRRLAVEVTPATPKVEPGAETSVAVKVRDASGKPVENAEVAVVVVDESVLALTGHAYPDPVFAFYGHRNESVQARQLRENVMLAALSELYGANGNMGAAMELAAQAIEKKEESMRMMKSADGEGFAGGVMPAPSAMAAAEAEAPGEGGAGPAAGPIAVRKNFDALALFLPDGKTDASGVLNVPVKMPDNLTRYRVVAVALSGPKHFGKGESNITARLPLMVRMSPPRFLNFGDRFELPIVLQNQTDAPLEVMVALRATNATVTDGGGRKVKVPANDRVEVRMPMAAAKPGVARFQTGVVSGRWADAAEVKLPVWTPATTEAFATYGEIDKGGIKQPVALPGEVQTSFGGLEIQTSSTQLQALTDAIVYLVNYPYECSEQISSRLMSLAALKDVLTAFKADGLPKPEAMIASVDRDLTRLRGMQAYDGGFAFWRRDQETWPFLTVHVTHALLRAKEKGFDVPEDMIRRALAYLRDIRSHMTREWYTESYKRTIESYALYVRALAGDVDAKRASQLLVAEGGADKANLELVGWLYPVSHAGKDEATLVSIRKHLNNRVSETAGAAHFVTSYGDGAYLLLHSDRRVDGLLLEGLIKDQPKSDLIPKLVRGLLGHRKQGRWGSTQENAWVLLGLDLYFNTYEKEVPNFKARAWLGALFAGEHTFKGRTTERHQIDVPMQKLADLGGKADLTLFKDGPGRMYYRIGMRYAPKSLKLAPSNHGFFVERVYEGVDDPKDVTRDSEGRWVIRAGARVKVKLTMHTEDRRYHVALVDPMPAGLEALNPELQGTQKTPGRNDDEHGGAWDTGDLGRGRYYWWWGPWYQHENLRDERAEAFTTLLWEGVYTYTYYARATTPGEFVVPPPKAEEMYSPETFGRGASDVVIVR